MSIIMSNGSIDSKPNPKKNKQKGHCMSAYVVNPHHIGQLVLWYLQNKSPGLNSIVHDGKDIFLDGKDLVLHLATANQDSVSHRYQDPAQPGFCAAIWGYMKDVRYTVKIKAADAYKMAICLRYQSCEHPDYKASAAARLLDMIQDCAGRKLAKDADFPWDYHDADVLGYNKKGVA